MKQAVRKYIPGFIFYRLKELETQYEYRKWKKAGCPVPPCHSVKRLAVREYRLRNGSTVLVETGTYKGDMICAQMNYFDELYSIELSDYYYREAVERFKKNKKVRLRHGDSAEVLKSIVEKIDVPVLFWLDGHYSGGLTAKGETECPIWGELDAILPTRLPHILLIDDARCFTGENGYPTLDELRGYLDGTGIPYVFEVKDDIIRIELNVSAE